MGLLYKLRRSLPLNYFLICLIVTSLLKSTLNSQASSRVSSTLFYTYLIQLTFLPRLSPSLPPLPTTLHSITHIHNKTSFLTSIPVHQPDTYKTYLFTGNYYKYVHNFSIMEGQPTIITHYADHLVCRTSLWPHSTPISKVVVVTILTHSHNYKH
jgi:hypothetical protein